MIWCKKTCKLVNSITLFKFKKFNKIKSNIITVKYVGFWVLPAIFSQSTYLVALKREYL